MKSKLFFSQIYKTIENQIADFLNQYPTFLTPDTSNSTRAIGDAVQRILENNLDKIIKPYVRDYTTNFPRRSMADISFRDYEDNFYIIDVKTHCKDTKFNMPNLTSVERLTKFYNNDKNYYVLLIISYNLIDNIKIRVSTVHFIPIEFLSWECLTIGALGWGQIQISNANQIIIIPGNSRKIWMIELFNKLKDFYPREINKIKERMKYFNKKREKWENKNDIWK